MIVKPKALKPGDTIGVIAAASNIKKDLLEQGCRELERLGFKTYCRPDITSSFRYFSGPHDRRTAEFLEMLKSPDIAAIFCARGGYGSGHLIPKVDRDTVCANAKIVNGSSDITILLNWIERCGVVSFHGPDGGHCDPGRRIRLRSHHVAGHAAGETIGPFSDATGRRSCGRG